MTADFPHRYEVSLQWKGGRKGELEAPPRPLLSGGPPPEFGGEGDSWSPEHLLLSAANLCLMTTFLAIAEKARLQVLGYRSRAEGLLDRGPSGIAFTGIVLFVDLEVPPGEVERAEDLLRTAKRHCIVANSLKVPVALEAKAAPGVVAR